MWKIAYGHAEEAVSPEGFGDAQTWVQLLPVHPSLPQERSYREFEHELAMRPIGGSAGMAEVQFALANMDDIMLEKSALDCHHLFAGLILQADLGLDHMIMAVPCLSCNRRGSAKKGGVWKFQLHQMYPGRIARNCLILQSLESFTSKMKS